MQVKDLVLVGYFSEIHELVARMGIDVSAIVDPKPATNLAIATSLYKSDEEFLAKAKNENVFLTPDLPNVRKSLYKLYSNAGHNLITLRCPTAIVSPSANISASCCIQSGANISSNVVLGVGVKVNCLANVMHDCTIGDFTTIAPSAVLLGGVKVGKGAYIGANATILPHLTIGSGATIGAGSVVTKSVTDNCVIYGNPARKSQ